MRLMRVDRRTARGAFDDGGYVVFDLNAPTSPLGATTVWDGLTTTCHRDCGLTFDELVADCIAWQHRYPGSPGLSFYVMVGEPIERSA